MRYFCLISDYDGTLAHDGQVTASTLQALKRVKASGRKLVLATGRELPELLRVFPETSLFDLLITDVGLPGGMNGRQVADAARVTRPELKVLFITGYAENAVIGNGHLEPGMAMLTKPFVIATLGNRIRDLIAR